MGLYQKTLGKGEITDLLIRLETIEGQYEKGTKIRIGIEKGKTRPTIKMQEDNLMNYMLAITYITRTSEFELYSEDLNTQQTGWTIAGKNADGQEIEANYPTQEEMQQNQTQILRQIGGYAVIHQHGTTICKIIEVGPPL